MAGSEIPQAGRFHVCCRACRALFVLLLLPLSVFAIQFQVHGTVADPGSRTVTGAAVELVAKDGSIRARGISDASGTFHVSTDVAGEYVVTASKTGFKTGSETLLIAAPAQQYQLNFRLTVGFSQSVKVTSDINQVDLFAPDPAEKVFVRQDLIDANPGRPGAPVSIPGYPIETASGGIKAPQYFAPGVAGDHGEPIAQFISIGGYLLPNNLSANAHGNGYADPNILIPAVVSDVLVDGGAFNVLEGNHSVNLATTYGLRTQLDPSLTVTGDYRDIDLVAGLSPNATSWMAFEAAYGNGFLRRLEHRQQYKWNAEDVIAWGRHRLTLAGIAYLGSSYIPGLIPINAAHTRAAAGDTIDPRQKDQTHTALLAFNDAWTIREQQQFQFSGFFRTYNLSLYSDFGQGLIRQSEFRTMAGGGVNYADRRSERWSLLAGVDFEREAPRRDNLDHYNFYQPGDNGYGPFTKVDGSNVTITPITPYVATQGALGRHVSYYAGWRRDQIDFDNEDLLQPQNSFHTWTGVNSPKATLSVVPGPGKWAPLLAASFGESFFTNDPRIGLGTTRGTPVSRAHSYQLVASKTVSRTDVKLTLGHVTTEEELAKIDPDTGLQENQGPGRLRFLTASVRQNFSTASLLVTVSKADARDVNSGQPTAEAPRTIVDVLGVTNRLPLHLQGKGEFEYVGAKPLGTGCNPHPKAQCIGVPVRELRAAVVRPFQEGRFVIGLNLLAASGFTGQTLESFHPSEVSEVSGVRIPSYASVSFTYRWDRHSALP